MARHGKKLKKNNNIKAILLSVGLVLILYVIFFSGLFPSISKSVGTDKKEKAISIQCNGGILNAYGFRPELTSRTNCRVIETECRVDGNKQILRPSSTEDEDILIYLYTDTSAKGVGLKVPNVPTPISGKGFEIGLCTSSDSTSYTLEALNKDGTITNGMYVGYL